MARPKTSACVRLWGENVGAVTWLEDDQVGIFEFEKEFLKSGLDVAPITMGLDDALRLDVPSFYFPDIDSLTFNGLPGLLANSLPDNFGNKLIDSWLRRHGRDPNSFNAVERLCYTGSRGMGALEFEPQVRSKRLNKTVDVDINNLLELTQEVIDDRSKLDIRIKENDPDKEKAEALLNILRVGTSAGGAVPKAIIAINDDGHIISGQSTVPEGYDHWILKFDGVSDSDPGEFGPSFEDCRVEYAYHLMAMAAGIDMMECRLLEENGRTHFLTKRFDRIWNKKIHVLSLACMAHFGWNPVGAYGYEDALSIMRELQLPYPEQEQQYRRMVFNALTRNVDDHTKNIGYMMDKDGVWQLAPAYDVTLSYDSTELLGSRHKMRINGKQKDFTTDDFVTVAHNMGINKPDMIIEKVIDTVDQWPAYAQQAGVAPDISKFVGDLHLTMDNQLWPRMR